VVTPERFAEGWATVRRHAAEAGRDPASITLSVKANCQIGVDESRLLFGSPAKIVDDIHRLRELGVELIVFAPNLQVQPTPLQIVDELASEIMAQLK